MAPSWITAALGVTSTGTSRVGVVATTCRRGGVGATSTGTSSVGAVAPSVTSAGSGATSTGTSSVGAVAPSWITAGSGVTSTGCAPVSMAMPPKKRPVASAVEKLSVKPEASIETKVASSSVLAPSSAGRLMGLESTRLWVSVFAEPLSCCWVAQ